MDARISQLLDEATAGLQDDPELRLDIKAELHTHLDATVQALHDEGMSEEESAGEALNQFGSPVEVAAELLAANQARMRRRALLRLAFRRFLIPLAVLVALWVGYGGLLQMQRLIRALIVPLRDFQVELDTVTQSAVKFAYVPLLPFVPAYRKEKADDPMAIIRLAQGGSYNDLLKPLLEAHKGDKRYLAYAASTYALSTGSDYLKAGQQLDPQNAIYNYLLAQDNLHGSYADDMSTVRQHDPVRYLSSWFKLTDRRKFEKAMREICRGLDKPYLRDYRQEVVREQLARLPAPANFTDYYQRALMLKFPSVYGHYREIARLLPFYAETLIREGRREEALAVLRHWKRLPEQLAQDSPDVLGVVVAAGCAKVIGEQTASIYDDLGMPELARHTRSELARFTAPTTVSAESPSIETLSYHTNSIVGEIQWLDIRLVGINMTNGYGAEVAEPQRTMGYKLFEEFALDALLVLLGAGILLVSVGQFFLLSRVRHAGAVPILLVPGWQQLARILLLGVVLPLTGYAVYTLLPISGRAACGVAQIFPRFVIEMLLLGGLIIVLSGMLTVRLVRKRCRHLRIPVPARGMKRQERQQAQFRLYYGSIAWSLVPIYALALILTTAICKPVLAHQERQAYLQDRLFFVHPGETVSPLEAETIEKLRRPMLASTGE